jgi:hypothetical protein
VRVEGVFVLSSGKKIFREHCLAVHTVNRTPPNSNADLSCIMLESSSSNVVGSSPFSCVMRKRDENEMSTSKNKRIHRVLCSASPTSCQRE